MTIPRVAAVLILLLVANQCAAQLAGRAEPSDLWVINVDGTGLTRFAVTTGDICGSPEWSPDGSLVAYDTWRVEQTAQDAHIMVARADGTGARDLGPGAMPNWSPDGKLIVCHTYAIGYDTEHIVVMNADGTGRESILDHWGSPRWSRRGNGIVTIFNNNLAWYDLTTGGELLLLPQLYPIYLGFGISPDGTRIAFSDNQSNLYLATLGDKTSLARVRTLVAGKTGCVSFAPDGRHIVFSSILPGDKSYQLYTMDVDSSDPPQRLAGQDRHRINRGPNWSRDGKRIIFASKWPAQKPTTQPETSKQSP